MEEDLGDEGRLPPTLTGVGYKLTREAIERIVSGSGAVRPYMATRMPSFGNDHATLLAHLFDEVDAPTDRPTFEQAGRHAWGRELIGGDGLSCITCHNLKGRKSLGIPAIDLATSPRRLRREWFHEYLLSPLRFRPGTRMPSFWPDGDAATKSIAGGDTHRQIESLWIYLRDIDTEPLPIGLADPNAYELTPTDQPIVFRTFMQDAGFHAIAVGYPLGVHSVFDAEQVRWAYAWTGRFLDAGGKWDDRMCPPTMPLGDIKLQWPDGSMIESSFPRLSTRRQWRPDNAVRNRRYPGRRSS